MPPAVRSPDRWAAPATATFAAAAVLAAVGTPLPSSADRAHPAVCRAVGVRESDPLVARVDVRTQARREVARAVADGRMTLAEAAAMFGWLNRQPPAVPADPGPDPFAALWEQAMRWVITQARRDRPDSAAEVAERVQGEYRAARAAGRLADLPAVSDEEGRALLEQAAAGAVQRTACLR